MPSNYFYLVAELRCFLLQAEFPHTGFAHLYDGPADNAYRAIYYARYIDWVSLSSDYCFSIILTHLSQTITTPLLLMELLLTTGLPLSYIFFTIFADIVMSTLPFLRQVYFCLSLFVVETGLIGALVTSRYKWGFFAFGCAAMCECRTFSFYFDLLINNCFSLRILGSRWPCSQGCQSSWPRRSQDLHELCFDPWCSMVPVPCCMGHLWFVNRLVTLEHVLTILQREATSSHLTLRQHSTVPLMFSLSPVSFSSIFGPSATSNTSEYVG